MISEQERGQLLQLLQSPQLGVVESIANSLCDKIRYDSTLRDNQWDTVKDTIHNDGQVSGIKRLLKELYNHVQS